MEKFNKVNQGKPMFYFCKGHRDMYYKSRLRCFFVLLKMSMKDFNSHDHSTIFCPQAMKHKQYAILKKDLDLLENTLSTTLNYVRYLRKMM